MKTKAIQRRYRAPKRSACGLSKSHQRGWADKKTPSDLRRRDRAGTADLRMELTGSAT